MAYPTGADGAAPPDLLERQREYDDLQQRCEAEWLWKSVFDQADFVLPIYVAAASPAERKAADALRESLAKKAGVKR